MKKLTLILVLLICTNAYGAYTGTMPKDIGTSTPLGSENPNVIDDVAREDRTVQVNLYKIKSVGTDTTLLANDTWVIGSSTSSSMLISFPAPSSCANSIVSKPFVITNVGTTTMILNIVVNGVGSRTVRGSETVRLFTDGTSWYEEVNFLNLGTQTSGSLSLGTQTSGTIGLGTQTSGTISFGTQTSGTVNLSTQTSSTISFGTQTSGLLSFGTQTNGTVALGTQTSGTLSFGTQTSGAVSLGTQTNGLLSLGTQTNGLLSFGTQTNGLLSLGTQTNGLLSLGTQTNGLLSLGTQTNGLLSFGTQTNGLLSLGTQTNGLLSLGTQTNGLLSLGTQTNGKISLVTQTTGNYLSGWTTGSQTTPATGSVRFEPSGDITLTSTYDNNGNGTITPGLAAGVSAKPDAKVDGVVQVTNPTAYAFPGTKVTITATNTTEALITFKDTSLGTQTNGLLSFGTQTNGLLSLGTQTNSLLSLGTQTNGTVGFSKVSGSPTANTEFIAAIPTANKVLVGLPEIVSVLSTTTAFIGTSANARVQNLSNTIQGINNGIDTNVSLMLQGGIPGSTSFTDSSDNNFTITTVGNTVGTTAAKYGGEGIAFDGNGDALRVPHDSDLEFGTQSFTIDWFEYLTTTAFTKASVRRSAEAFPTNPFNLGYLDTGENKVYFTSNGSTWDIANGQSLGTANTGTWTHLAVVRDTSNWYAFKNGSITSTWTGTQSIYATTGQLCVGGTTSEWFTGVLDGVRISKGVARWTANFTVPTEEYDRPYNQIEFTYRPSHSQNNLLKIVSGGTTTGKATYIFNIATTTAHGYSTTTAMSSVGSSTVYSTESLNAELATNFIVKSKDTKGRNFQEFSISALDKISNSKVMSWNPVNHKDLYRLDAEAMAKEAFVRQNKENWKSLHELEYIKETVVTGTGTINVIDNVAMEQGYRDYIEIEWASFPEQNDWINTVEDNAESDLTRREYGLRLADPSTPDELRKPGGIGLMDWAALNTKAIQELKVIIGSLTVRIEKAGIPP